MRLSCIRHGSTALNRSDIFSSRGEEGIEERQRRDLESIEFDSTGFDGVYCSPAQRCKETAQSLRLPSFVEEPRLAERRFGIFEGLTAAECRSSYPAEFELFQRLDADFVIPGGESRREHLARILEWLQSVSTHRHVLAVTHGGTIDFLSRLGKNEPPHGGEEVFAGPNAAISVFEVSLPSVALVEYGVPLSEWVNSAPDG